VYLSLLDKVSDHDDTAAVGLPGHAPHVVNAPLIATCKITIVSLKITI